MIKGNKENRQVDENGIHKDFGKVPNYIQKFKEDMKITEEQREI